MESEYVIQFNGSLKLTKSSFFFQFLRVLFPLFKTGADLKFSPRVLHWLHLFLQNFEFADVLLQFNRPTLKLTRDCKHGSVFSQVPI